MNQALGEFTALTQLIPTIICENNRYSGEVFNQDFHDHKGTDKNSCKQMKLISPRFWVQKCNCHNRPITKSVRRITLDKIDDGNGINGSLNNQLLTV